MYKSGCPAGITGGAGMKDTIKRVPIPLCGVMLGMAALATILYLFSLVKALGLLAKPFYPSIASFTFPFIISAIASKQAMACLTKMGRPIPGLNYAVLIETVIAVLLMVYVLLGYARFLFFTKQK